MFRIHFLPARFGDSIWIEYGAAFATKYILIDGGTRGTRHDIKAKLMGIPEEQRALELMIVTHIDRDHIEGVLGLLESDELGFKIDDLWFNGWFHLSGDEYFGAVQGERLTKAILTHHLPWNKHFSQQAVVVPDQGNLPVYTLPGGMKITLLLPTRTDLLKLIPAWEKEVKEANLDPGVGYGPNDYVVDEGDESFGAEEIDIQEMANRPFNADDSAANGSSIAFIAEYDNKKALFAADAHADKLYAALDRYSPGTRVNLDLFKVSHHGSARTTDKAVIEKVHCSNYVFSTNGSIHYHPDKETVARVIVSAGSAPRLFFNYRSVHSEIWESPALKRQYRYQTKYPAAGKNSIVIDL
jgi:hypothetical protein